MAASDAPRQFDLDRCVHCGLCLNACPSYRELGVEMDSPRGRIYQMVQVTSGAAPITDSYREHIDLCLACRGCETACPSGVQYGRLVEAARAQIEADRPNRLRALVLNRLFSSPLLMRAAGRGLQLYHATGLRKLARRLGFQYFDDLTPSAEPPFFFREIGKVYPAEGERRYRVAFLAGCIANISFARLNEATVRVLRKNGCEVVIPKGQGCCGALHLHAGLRDFARKLARRNLDAFLSEPYDAVITNAAGCGSTLKEYGELLEEDSRGATFAALVRDVNEFLAAIGVRPPVGALQAVVTYQDSCHLAHGQKVRAAPRQLLAAVPGLEFREMPLADLCCGSAGTYNLAHPDIAGSLLEKKMAAINGTGASIVATANPGCLLQLRAGVARHGRGQRVMHVVEILDEAYGAA